MLYYNYDKLKLITANIKESLRDLDNALAVYDDMKDKRNMEKIIANSIRMSFVQIKEEIFSAIASILKSSRLSVNTFRNNIDIIEECRENGYFLELDNEFFIILNKYSSSSCHRDKQPSIDDIKSFYEARKEQIIYILSDLDKITSGK